MNKVINYRIQSLRGIAFLLIFTSHCALIYDNQGGNLLNWLGGLGVELFIILSGYLAFQYYPTSINIKEYYRKKIFRFIPLHLLTLIMAVPLCLPITNKTLCKIVINATLLQVWIPRESIYFSMNAVSWYLGITVFFILITPCLVGKVQNFTIKKSCVLLFVIQILQIIIVFIAYKIPVDTHWVIYVFPLSRTLDFLAGGILYMLAGRMKNVNCYKLMRNLGWFLNVIALIISIMYTNEFSSVTIWFIPSLLIVFGVCGENSKKENLLSRIGNISFELFLFHQLVIRYVEIIAREVNFNERWVIFVITLMISIVVALSYKYLVDIQKQKRQIHE